MAVAATDKAQDAPLQQQSEESDTDSAVELTLSDVAAAAAVLSLGER